MKCILLFYVLSASGILCASEQKTTVNVRINEELILLIGRNNVTGRVYYNEGQNLAEIENFIQRNKKEIDFTFTASGEPTTCGLGGKKTALQMACASAICSHLVVDLLCKHGAQPLKYDGDISPATHCFIRICDHYIHYGQYEPDHNLYKNQLQKLNHLKETFNEVLEVDAKNIRKITDTLKDHFEENKNRAGYDALIKGTTLACNE